MSTTQKSVDGYVAALPDGVQSVFEAVRAVIRQAAPGAEEAIKYGMPVWLLPQGQVIYAAAWKNHIGLYPVYRGDAGFEALVGPWRDKKDTVRLDYAKPMAMDVVAAIVAARVAELESKP
jgi:uncharacterized protein YdhG (YjbR/CyaY superfamily)